MPFFGPYHSIHLDWDISMLSLERTQIIGWKKLFLIAVAIITFLQMTTSIEHDEQDL